VNRIQAAHLSETSTIANAVRRIREDASIIQEARRSLNGALDLLGLGGTAREAVRPLLAAACSRNSGSLVVTPETFWFG